MRWAFWKAKKGFVSPRRPEKPGKRYVELSNPVGMSNYDWDLVHRNTQRIELSYRLGLDLALRRDGSPSEYLIPGSDPSALNGFVVIRNQDA